jgi:hypothetical protein
MRKVISDTNDSAQRLDRLTQEYLLKAKELLRTSRMMERASRDLAITSMNYIAKGNELDRRILYPLGTYPEHFPEEASAEDSPPDQVR